MLMALNRHMLHKSLLNFQQHIASSSNTLKVVASTAVANNNGLTQTIKRSSSFQQQSSSSDSEGDETLRNNPYYTAYAEKLKALKKNDTDAYRKALRRLREKEQETVNTVDAAMKPTTDIGSDKTNSITTQTQAAKPKRRPSQSLLVKPKTLDQVMNMELLRDKSWRDVSEIWLAYHRTRDETLSAVIPLNLFNKFYKQSMKYPMFILPLPRNTSGYEFIFAQFQHYQEHSTSNCSVHLTPLICYQTYNENAPECMTVEYYTDLCKNDTAIENSETDNESCVLMRSTYDGKLLSAAEASCLVNQLRIFYGVDSGAADKEKLLKLFNEGDITFKHSDVIALLETLSI